MVKDVKIDSKDIIYSVNFFENFYGQITSISMLSINKSNPLTILSPLLKFFTDRQVGLWKKKYLINVINYFKEMNAKTDKKNEKEKEKVKDLKDFIVFMFTPITVDPDCPNVVEDYLQRYALILEGKMKNHRYINYQKNLMKICKINNFLPIAEMFLMYKDEILNEKNFFLYLRLILKLVSGKKNLEFMNDSNFFQLLSLFLVKVPNSIMNEKVLTAFDLIGKVIMDQNLAGSSNFFNDIVLNENIIVKFSEGLQIQLWNTILKLCQIDKQKIESFININKISVLLLYYDRNKYKEMCCKFHKNMYKKELVENLSIMEPPLNEKLIHIKKTLDAIISSQSPEKVLSLYDLLIMNLSPCLMKFIISIFIASLDYNNKNEEWKNQLVLEMTKNKYFIITVNAFAHSGPDIRYELLILMNSIFIRLIKLNKDDKFEPFEKMIKTCLIPDNFYYINEKDLPESQSVVTLIKDKKIGNKEKEKEKRQTRDVRIHLP